MFMHKHFNILTFLISVCVTVHSSIVLNFFFRQSFKSLHSYYNFKKFKFHFSEYCYYKPYNTYIVGEKHVKNANILSYFPESCYFMGN